MSKLMTDACLDSFSFIDVMAYDMNNSEQYRHLAAENPEYAYIDYVAATPLESYYNGLNTLREKTYIAMEKAGGVMLDLIWHGSSNTENLWGRQFFNGQLVQLYWFVFF